MRLAYLLLCCVAACAAVHVSATHLGGAERQLDPYSPFVRGLKDGPLPADWERVLVLAHLMSYAHDVEATASLVRLVEREALLEILGEPAPPRPARVEDAIRERGVADRMVEALRVRVLDRALLAEPIQDHAPQDDGGSRRGIGVKIINPGTHEVLGGFLELQIGPAGKALRFSCRFNEPIAAGGSKTMLCYGDRSKPIDDVLHAVRGAGPAARPMAQYEIAYRLRGSRFAVGGANTGFIGEGQKIEKLALEMLHDQSCGARRACAAAVAEELENPLLAGFALGVATCFIVLLVAWIAGLEAGAWVGTGIVVVLGVLAAAFVIAIAVMTSNAHILLVLLLTGAAAGHVGEMGVGFLAGVAALSFAARMLGAVRRRARAA